METTAYRTLANMAEFGAKKIVHVLAQIIKYGMVKNVFLLKFHVIMVEYGI